MYYIKFNSIEHVPTLKFFAYSMAQCQLLTWRDYTFLNETDLSKSYTASDTYTAILNYL